MILHIPHASIQTLDYELNNRDREILRMTDWFTDDLYTCKGTTKVIFTLSRLICDVERFEDDKLEPMSNFGMGVCYTTDTQGEVLRDVSSKDRAEIIKKYYRSHHQSLSDKVDAELQNSGSSLIIDCHSFPDQSYYFNSDFKEKRPDICIGTDNFHTPPSLIKIVKEFFCERGYDVRVDDPYTGTLVPLKHYKKDKRVKSIMIEINRKLYMNEDGSKNKFYEVLKGELTQVLESLKENCV